MKFNKRTLSLILIFPTIRADDQSCFENGKWMGEYIEPDGSTSWPEEKAFWDLSDEDIDNQPKICESIRLIMGGVAWHLKQEDDKAECKVLLWLVGSEEKDNYIRSVVCSPAYTPTSEPTYNPDVTEKPTQTVTEKPTSEATYNPTVTEKPTSEPTYDSAVTEEPTQTVTETPTSEPTYDSAVTEEPIASPTPSPTASTNTAEPTSMLIIGTIEPQAVWYYSMCGILLSMLCCFMTVAYCWMADREEYIEKRHADPKDNLESLRERLQGENGVQVQAGPSYTKQGWQYKGVRMSNAPRSLSNSSGFSNRSTRLQFSNGRTIWRGSIDDCSMDDEEVIHRRFSANPQRESSDRRLYSYSDSQVQMTTTSSLGSGLLNRGYMSTNTIYNKSAGVTENPNLNAFNITKALKTAGMAKCGSISPAKECTRSTPDDIYGDKVCLLHSTEDTSQLINVNSPGTNSEASLFNTPTEVEIEVKICKQEAPIPEGLEEDDEEERTDSSNEEAVNGKFIDSP